MMSIKRTSFALFMKFNDQNLMFFSSWTNSNLGSMFKTNSIYYSFPNCFSFLMVIISSCLLSCCAGGSYVGPQRACLVLCVWCFCWYIFWLIQS